MGFALEDPLHQRAGRAADPLAPPDEPIRTPLDVLLVGFRAVAGIGGEAADAVTAGVHGDALPAIQDLDGPGGETNVDLLTDERVRNAVIVALDLDVVIDVDARLPPLREGAGSGGQRGEFGPVEFLEATPPTARELLERPVVQLLQEPGDLPVRLGETHERLVAQRRQDPALADLNAGFHLGFVPRRRGSGRQNGGPVVPCQIEIGGIDVRLVVAGVADAGRMLSGMVSLGTAPK